MIIIKANDLVDLRYQLRGMFPKRKHSANEIKVSVHSHVIFIRIPKEYQGRAISIGFEED